jgi:hypothetical protein
LKHFLVTKVNKKSMTKGNSDGSIEGNVPLSQATKKKCKSPWNEDNLSMCVFIMLSYYFIRHLKPAFSRRFISAFESLLLLGVPPILIAL